jgi:hypothetical protein
VVAWGTKPLQHGTRSDNCRRGCQAAQSGARGPGRGTHAYCQPNEGHPGPAGHSQLQTNPAHSGRGLATLHTPEGSPLPPNVSAELQRDMARLRFVISQIKGIEDTRQKRLEQEPETAPHAMVRLLARVVGSALKRQICWSMRCSRGGCATKKRRRATPA